MKGPIEGIHEMMTQDQFLDLEIYIKKMSKLPELGLDGIKK